MKRNIGEQVYDARGRREKWKDIAERIGITIQAALCAARSYANENERPFPPPWERRGRKKIVKKRECIGAKAYRDMEENGGTWEDSARRLEYSKSIANLSSLALMWAKDHQMTWPPNGWKRRKMPQQNQPDMAARAYSLRMSGIDFDQIAKSMEFSSRRSASESVRQYAVRHGLPTNYPDALPTPSKRESLDMGRRVYEWLSSHGGTWIDATAALTRDEALEVYDRAGRTERAAKRWATENNIPFPPPGLRSHISEKPKPWSRPAVVRAYEMAASGAKWNDVASTYGFRTGAGTLNAVASYARRTGRPWPLKLRGAK